MVKEFFYSTVVVGEFDTLMDTGTTVCVMMAQSWFPIGGTG